MMTRKVILACLARLALAVGSVEGMKCGTVRGYAYFARGAQACYVAQDDCRDILYEVATELFESRYPNHRRDLLEGATATTTTEERDLQSIWCPCNDPYVCQMARCRRRLEELPENQVLEEAEQQPTGYHLRGLGEKKEMAKYLNEPCWELLSDSAHDTFKNEMDDLVGENGLDLHQSHFMEYFLQYRTCNCEV